MITKLTIDEVIKLATSKPEQSVFDWKVDFVVPSDDEKKGELLKDIAAIANSSSHSYGFLLYGVDPGRPDPVVGITSGYDDAKLQQLVAGKIQPAPEFLYYEVSAGPRVVAVIQISPSRKRPHIITVDLGKVRRGQIVVRRGSSTDGVTLQDLFEFFYGENSAYFAQVCKQLGLDVQRQQALNAYLTELRLGAEKAEQDMWEVVDLTPPSRR